MKTVVAGSATTSCYEKGALVIAPVEIKVNIATSVTDALAALGCAGTPPVRRDMWFAEARARGDHDRLPLLAGHLTIRLRSGDRDDVTVAVRPCDTDLLVGRWRAPFDEPDFSYRLEWNWCGERREVASYAISRRPPGSVAASVVAGEDPAHILDAAQRQFVVTCTPGGVPIDHLMTLGPVACQTWPEIDLDGCPVHVERWSVGAVDVLDLAAHIQPRSGESQTQFDARCAAGHRALCTAVADRGLSIAATDGPTTTHRVMSALAYAS